ncbi:DUF167 domain-containing protein [Candidatus Parcubacteria bacterium]|jgi:uncharacterized protein (TIGR00251 family)|nr:MAG: DUF167 domain-containing protein [Candidatus Parcubacteria bacterium]
MKILVRVDAQAKKSEVVVLGERCFRIKTTKPAKEGKANNDVIALLASHFHISKSEIELLSGHRSKEKIFEIPN